MAHWFLHTGLQSRYCCTLDNGQGRVFWLVHNINCLHGWFPDHNLQKIRSGGFALISRCHSMETTALSHFSFFLNWLRALGFSYPFLPIESSPFSVSIHLFQQPTLNVNCFEFPQWGPCRPSVVSFSFHYSIYPGLQARLCMVVSQDDRLMVYTFLSCLGKMCFPPAVKGWGNYVSYL